MFNAKSKFLLPFLLILSPAMYAQNIIYVSQTATGTNSGESWPNAFNDLQDALGQATAGGQIWVAAGIYVPGNSPTHTFSLIEGVGLYGGFQGTETLLEQRDPAVNPTILSGDINQDDVYGSEIWYNGWTVNSGNSYHVVSGANISRTAILDGFIVEAGYFRVTLGWTYLTNSGGGLFLQNASPTVKNCLFRRNTAWKGRGGAIYNSGGHPLITDCSFHENFTSQGRGAGISNEAGGDLTIISCSFTNNRLVGADIAPALGGAIYSDVLAGTVVVKDCIFENNILDSFYAIAQNPNYGGAIYSAGEGLEVYNSKFINNESHLGGAIGVGSGLLLVNSILSNNVAYPLEGGVYSYGDRGGAIYFAGSSAQGSQIVNSTIVNNSGGEGAGIFNADPMPFLLHNSIVFDNVATAANVWILKAQIGGEFDAMNSCVEGLLQTEPGEIAPDPANFPGCIDVDPLLDYLNPQLALSDNSPCIDAGNNTLYNPVWPAEGLDGQNRFSDNPLVADTGEGIAPIIDMGASENSFAGTCNPVDIDQPTGLNVSFNPNFFTLSWNSIPGTGPCQIQAGSSFSNAQSLFVQGDAPSTKNIPLSYLNQGVTYGWRVRCYCSSTPNVAGPWSAIYYFSMPAAISMSSAAEATIEDDITIYPNPGDGLYQVQVGSSQSGFVIIRNALGQEIDRIGTAQAVALFQVNIDGPAGLYFFQFYTVSGEQIATRKVIKR
jgi:hypothetical protein